MHVREVKQLIAQDVQMRCVSEGCSSIFPFGPFERPREG
jgi:hypothetical protein